MFLKIWLFFIVHHNELDVARTVLCANIAPPYTK